MPPARVVLALALCLLIPAGADAASKQPPLKAGEVKRRAAFDAHAARQEDPLGVDSRVRACVPVGTYRFNCALSVIEDRPDGIRSCDWNEGIKRVRHTKLRSFRLVPTRCARPNLALTEASSWYSYTYAATVDAFEADGTQLRVAATANGLSAHVAAGFTAQSISPGRRYSFSVQVDVRRETSAPQAIWFVWVAADGSGIYELMGSQVTHVGSQTLAVSDIAPPGAGVLLCAIGNGGPSRDGRNNVMNVPESSEFIVNTATATLLDGGKA